MIILGIETSCDETALSLIEAQGSFPDTNFKILGTALISQIDIHKEYGGVYPMLAKREHSKNLVPLLQKLLEETSYEKKQAAVITLPETISTFLEREPELLTAFLAYISTIEKPHIDAIAVTTGPGLEPALWVGINFAKALSEVWTIPVIPTNHMEGHIVSALLEKNSNTKSTSIKPLQFPALALLISGGHTQLVLMKEWLNYEVIGDTRDDAVGEAFDKVARMMNLPYPGGPQISHRAELNRTHKTSTPAFILPRPMITSPDYDFSFSGLKTAVLYTLKKIPPEIASTEETKQAISEEFENAVTEVLVSKTQKAIDEFSIKTLIIGGGVIANSHIRSSFEKLVNSYENIQLLLPDASLSTDNAVMIAMSGYFNYHSNQDSPNSVNSDLKAIGNLSL